MIHHVVALRPLTLLQLEAMGAHLSEVTSELTKARVEVLDAQAEASFMKQEAEGVKQQLARAQQATTKQVGAWQAFAPSCIPVPSLLACVWSSSAKY